MERDRMTGRSSLPAVLRPRYSNVHGPITNGLVTNIKRVVARPVGSR